MDMRERIIEGLSLMAQKQSINDIRMDELADFLEISKKTIYNHFSSKHELIDELKYQFMRKSIEEAEDVINNKELLFVQKIDALLEIAFKGFAHGRKITASRGKHDESFFLTGLNQRLRTYITKIIRDVVDEAKEGGLLQESIETETLTYILFNIVEGLFIPENTDFSPISPATILSSSLEYMFGGVLSEKGKEELKDIYHIQRGQN